MNRRTYLRAAGTTLAGVALAGCTDPDGGTTEEPDGSGPTADTTTTRRPTDEVRSTTTVESTPTPTPAPTSDTPTASSTDEARTTDDG